MPRSGNAGVTVSSAPNGKLDVLLLAEAELDRAAYVQLIRHIAPPLAMAGCGLDAAAVWASLRLKPAIVATVSDVASPAVLDALRMARTLLAGVRILVISGAVDIPQIEGWGRCSLDAFVPRQADARELRAALDALLAGGTHIPLAVRSQMERSRLQPNGVIKLSHREEELLPLLARGMTLRAAAAQLNIRYKTADSYRTSLLKKLRVRDRVELARYAIRHGIIQA